MRSFAIAGILDIEHVSRLAQRRIEEVIIMNPEVIPINQAYAECDWLIVHSETRASRYLARKIKRVLGKMFKEAIKGAVKEKDKEQAWRLSTLLLKNETLHPSPDELIHKATLQQKINVVAKKIVVAENENLLKE